MKNINKHEMVDYRLIEKITNQLRKRPSSINDIKLVYKDYSSYAIESTLGILWHSGRITNEGNWLSYWIGVANKEFNKDCKYVLTLTGKRL